MKKYLRAMVYAAFLTAALASTSNAQSWCNGTGTTYYHYQGSYSPYSNGTCHGWTSTGSGHVFGVNMYWNQSGRNGVQSYASSGKRYTHDMTDLNDNLSATGTYSTNFPSPAIDFDDDDGNGEWEEWEVTAQSSSFPSVGTKYYIQFWASWKATSGASGNIAYTPAISEKLWYTSDLWDTYRYDRGLNRHYSRLGNLFEYQGKLPADEIFVPRKENENEKQFDRRYFEEPISVEDLFEQTRAAGIKVGGYALEYEVETPDGPQIVTIGLVPTDEEFLPNDKLTDMINNMPDGFVINKFRGVVSYYFDADQLDERADQ